MASKQDQVVDSKTGKTKGWFTYGANMTNVKYSYCDSLVPEDQSEDQLVKEIHYKVNLSKHDRIVGGKHLALCDSGANGLIIGLYMLILYFNSDDKRISIGIAGDHQLIGNRLCTRCTLAKSNVGWIKLIWPQGTQVKTQRNLILPILQMRDNGYLYRGVSKQHVSLFRSCIMERPLYVLVYW